MVNAATAAPWQKKAPVNKITQDLEPSEIKIKIKSNL